MIEKQYVKNKDFIKSYIAKRKKLLQEEINNIKGSNVPSLLIIQVGDNFASNKYVNGKLKDCEEVGILCTHNRLDSNISEDKLLEHIRQSSHNYDGIIVQLPLPKHINVNKINDSIPSLSDVDGFKKESIFIPCTPLGIYNLLLELHPDDKKLNGKRVIVLGRSDIVGKPMANLLIERTNATVTVCNSYTKNIGDITKTADIIISAVGKPKFVTNDMIPQDCVVIDVGINMDEEGKLCGDVDWKNINKEIKFITPVPGGVGLLTRLSLLENTLLAYKLHNKD